MSVLTLAFSTTDRAFQSLLQRAERFPRIDGIHYLVICQKVDHGSVPIPIEDDLKSSRPDVSVYCYNEKGISRSRNRVIDTCKSTYVWFLDDDASFDFGLIRRRLIGELQSTNIDIVLCQIGSLEKENEFYKDYGFRNGCVSPTRLQMLKASSIEVICRCKFLQKSGIKFDEKIGLGTDYPCGEEIIFLLDLFDQGAKIQYLNYPFVRHTTLKGGRLPVGIGHFKARGDVAKRFCLPVRIGLITRWSSRGAAVPLLKRLACLIKGIQGS